LDLIKLLKCIEGGVGPGLKSCGLRWVTFIAAEVLEKILVKFELIILRAACKTVEQAARETLCPVR